eukprot:1375716-Rhodomonas_salina.1
MSARSWIGGRDSPSTIPNTCVHTSQTKNAGADPQQQAWHSPLPSHACSEKEQAEQAKHLAGAGRAGAGAAAQASKS